MRSTYASAALAALLVAGAARADTTSAEDLATARERLREGVVLRDKGEIHPAIEKLRVAYTIIPTPITAVELGKAYALAGRVLDARELYLSVRRIAVHPEETSRSHQAREEAARAAIELEPRIPSLVVALRLPKGATATVTIDEGPVLVDSLKDPRKVNPGSHVVVARAGDGPEWKGSITVAEGETKTIEVEPVWVPPKPKPTGGAAGERYFVRQSINPAVWIGFSVASLGLVTTTIFTTLTFDKASAKSACQDRYCLPSVIRGDIADARGYGFVATAGGVALASGLIVGFIGMLVPKTERVTITGAAVRPGVPGVSGTF